MAAADAAGAFLATLKYFLQREIRLPFTGLRVPIAMLLALAATSPAARAANHALLVGVSDYQNLPPENDLRAPKNDVARLREALVERGVPGQNIQVLADGVEGARLPTRAAIMAALEALVATVAEDRSRDFVTLYFSGHGFQQPDRDGDEDDGFDELFLPIDIARWGGPGDGPKAVRNAIRDEEIGAAVTGLRNAGADVWVIMDSCHSGTGIRASSRAVRAKRLRAADLGFDGAPAALTRKETGFVEDNGALAVAESAGYLVAFFASQSSQQALEIGYPLDAREGEARVYHSLFTSKLVNRLKRGGHPTFRQLYQAVRLDIDESQERDGRPQNPDLEADKPETPDNFPFAAALETPAAQWRLRHGRIVEAGELQGLLTGSILALVADPGAAEGDAIGHVQVTKAGALSASVAPIDYPCRRSAAGDATCAPARTDEFLHRARFARLLEPGLDLSLRLSKPFFLDDESRPENAPLLAALAALAARSADELGLTLLFDQDPFDVAIGFKGGRIWFGDDSGFDDFGLDGPVSSVAWPVRGASHADVDGLKTILQRIGKVKTLSKVAKALNAGQKRKLFADSNPIALDVKVTAVDRAALSRMTTTDLERGCEALAGVRKASLAELDGNLVHCDRILFDVTLRLPKPSELWIFYVDAEYGVHVGFPRGAPSGNVVAAGGTRTDVKIFGPLCTICKDKTKTPYLSFGRERVFVVALEKTPGRPVDLRHLAQPSLTAIERDGIVGMRSDESAKAALTELLFSGARTRGRAGSALRERVWIKEVGWTLWPHDAIAARARN